MKKPIRVLYISPVAERGGAERVLYNLIKFHNRNICEPYVFFLQDGPFVKEIRKLGIPIFLYEAGRLRYLSKSIKTIYKIIRFIQSNEINIVNGNSSMGHIYGGLAALFAMRQKVWFQHTCSNRFNMIDQIATLIPSDIIITNSFYTASLQKAFFPYHSNITVIYPGVDLSEFNPDASKGKAIRDVLGIKPSEKVIGLVGRIQRWKGHSFFIDAAYRVKKNMPNTKFLIVGDEMFHKDSGYMGELLNLVKSLGIADSVIFAGFNENVQDYIDAMDILVHASIHPEAFGLAICEGMAMGKLVIASDAGGPREIITGPEIGYLCPPGNSFKLAELIVKFLNSPDEMRKIGLNAEKYIRENFSADKMVDRMEILYQEIINEKNQRNNDYKI